MDLRARRFLVVVIAQQSIMLSAIAITPEIGRHYLRKLRRLRRQTGGLAFQSRVDPGNYPRHGRLSLHSHQMPCALERFQIDICYATDFNIIQRQFSFQMCDAILFFKIGST
jgi:hypothetical protein